MFVDGDNTLFTIIFTIKVLLLKAYIVPTTVYPSSEMSPQSPQSVTAREWGTTRHFRRAGERRRRSGERGDDEDDGGGERGPGRRRRARDDVEGDVDASSGEREEGGRGKRETRDELDDDGDEDGGDTDVSLSTRVLFFFRVLFRFFTFSVVSTSLRVDGESESELELESVGDASVGGGRGRRRSGRRSGRKADGGGVDAIGDREDGERRAAVFSAHRRRRDLGASAESRRDFRVGAVSVARRPRRRGAVFFERGAVEVFVRVLCANVRVEGRRGRGGG